MLDSATVIEQLPRPALTRAAASGLPACESVDLGCVEYGAAWRLQRELVEDRKQGLIGDRLLFAEHPHVLTLGRTAKPEHLLASRQQLEEAGVALWETDRGGDITYHGPGQIIGYPILDLRFWKRDVVAYLRALEEVLIRAVGEFGIGAGRFPGHTGVWVRGAKLAALGVHVSRWVTSHGFALNVATNPRYFKLIVPCGLTLPVTSMAEVLGVAPERQAVQDALAHHFGAVFGRRMIHDGI
jgi:lipoyl(octanoyl) transferase